MKRTLIIGDVHGCYDELSELLDQAAIGDKDQIIFVGDLFDKGPHPDKVLRLFRRHPNMRSVRGNHEEKHRRAARGEIPLPGPQCITRHLLDRREYARLVRTASAMPLRITTPHAYVIHGYLKPRTPLRRQPDLMLIGRWEAERELENRYKAPWYEYYHGDRPVIVGHRDYSGEQQVFRTENGVIGLDTRCVYGGALSGLLLPDWRFIRVSARANHHAEMKNRYRHLC